MLLGAFLDEVIYSQPIQVIGGSSDPELASRLGLAPSRYEGPTGIVGVIADAIQRADVPTLSLWARLPHYVQETPNSRAALALLQRVEAVTGFPFDKASLETAAADLRPGGLRGDRERSAALRLRARVETPRVLAVTRRLRLAARGCAACRRGRGRHRNASWRRSIDAPRRG